MANHLLAHWGAFIDSDESNAWIAGRNYLFFRFVALPVRRSEIRVGRSPGRKAGKASSPGNNWRVIAGRLNELGHSGEDYRIPGTLAMILSRGRLEFFRLSYLSHFLPFWTSLSAAIVIAPYPLFIYTIQGPTS
jgi:hypothetical protein